MVASVPTLEGSVYLQDPLTIITYTLKRYMRMPLNTAILLPELIISLPAQCAAYGREPDILVGNIKSDLQTCLERIFNGERDVSVLVSYDTSDTGEYDVSISITYAVNPAEVNQVGVTVSLDKNGRPIIAQDSINMLSGYTSG